MIRTAVAAAATVATLLAAAAPGVAAASDMEVWITSNDKHTVHVQLFAQSRNVIWPSPSDVWVIDDWDENRFEFSCREGEKICYGAWVAGTQGDEYWGAGFDGEDACESCCFRCEDNSYVQYELNQ